MHQQTIHYPDLNKRLLSNAVDISLILILLLFKIFIPTITIVDFTLSAQEINYLYFLFLYIYFYLIPSLTGQTLGKRLTKIKVVYTKNKSKLSLFHAHLRELYKYVFVVLSLLTTFSTVLSNVFFVLAIIYFMINVFLILESNNKRGIHDRILDSVVIELEIPQYHRIQDEYEETYFFKTKK